MTTKPKFDDDGGPGRPEPQPNPVRRADLQARFVDGKWWTAAGMAAALGGQLADDLAVRYYRYKYPGALEGAKLSTLIAAARRACVTVALVTMAREGLAETRKQEGVTLYKLRDSVPRRTDPSRAARPVAQKGPADTQTGLTVAGLLAALVDRGNECPVEDLVEALTPCMVPADELVAWYRETYPRDNPAVTIKPGVTDAELLAQARRYAVMRMVGNARSNHPVTTERRVIVKYAPPADPDDAAAAIPDRSPDRAPPGPPNPNPNPNPE